MTYKCSQLITFCGDNENLKTVASKIKMMMGLKWAVNPALKLTKKGLKQGVL